MIHTLKLTSGDTLLVNILSEEDDILTVCNPLQIQIVNNPYNGPGIMSVLWIPLDFATDNVIDIRQNHVMAITAATEDLEKFYHSSIQNFFKSERNERVNSLMKETNEELKELEKEHKKELLLLSANTETMH